MVAAASPTLAQSIVSRFGADYSAIGADSVKAVDQKTVAVTFSNNYTGTNAQAALRDSVDGAQVLVRNASTTLDHQIPTSSGFANLLNKHPDVSKATVLGDIAGDRDAIVAELKQPGSDAGNRLKAIFNDQTADALVTIDPPRRGIPNGPNGDLH